ncbi:DUF550 domain-containing protein [Salmonella enterica]|nr:DUF550 domain-containing protein [Salmonella enterica]
MTTITREQLIEKLQNRIAVTANYPGVEEAQLDAAIFKIALASLEAETVASCIIEDGHMCVDGFCEYVDHSLPDGTYQLYTAPPASEREQIRREHAEWSDATFGDVGPVGPLKHLSKEALEAAAIPSDPLEWADMQFLLWDAQRRAGITDEQITQAMIEKLAINKSRQWPEPKDGEPRLHIKEQPVPVVPPAIEPDYKVIKSILPTANPDEYACCIAADMWNACRAAMLQGVEQPQNARQNIPENIPDGNSPVTPDGWISCSERMPDNDESKPIAIFTGKYFGQGMFVATYDDDGFFDYWEGMEIIGVTHWMPLPEPPQEVNRG